MEKSSRIVVLGASGLVGSAIVRALRKRGYTNITGTYRTRGPKDFGDGVRLVRVDLTDQHETENLFREVRPEYVFFAASRVGGILANSTYKADFIHENLAIAVNVVRLSYKMGVRKLLNLGSSCIYPRNSPQPMKEEYLLTGPLEPTNEPYAVAKIATIKLCRYYNEQYGTNFISAMPTNLYGPNDNFDLFTSHVIPALIRKFHLGKCLMAGDWSQIRNDLRRRPIEGVDGDATEGEILETLQKHGILKDAVVIWGTGSAYREFLHVDDLADACVFLMEKISAQDMRKFCLDYFVNVGTGEDLTIRELVALVRDTVGYEGGILYDRSKPDGTPRKLLDVSKIHHLGWRHKIDLKDGLKSVYEWYIYDLGS